MNMRKRKASLFSLAAKLCDVETELKDLQDLFDLQRKRMGEATAIWQKATGNTYNPDLGELLTWLLNNLK